MEDPELEKLPKEILLEMAKTVRSLAWIGLADGRTPRDKDDALRQILVVTKRVGND